MIRLVIADDHPIVRAGLRAVFGSDERFEVVADVASAEEAIALCAANPRVELVTMDLQFPSGMSGVEAVEALSALEHPPLVLVLTNYDTDDSILAAIEAGARGERLFLAPTTVKTHVARLFTTLGVSSRTAALARARELGLFDS